MTLSIEQLLADKGIHPAPEHLPRLEAKWAEIRERRSDLAGVALDDADIALRNVPGGDHVH